MSDNRIRLFTKQDLGFAQSLSAIVGWNQTNEDWLRMLESSPEGCFLCEHNGQPAATATTVCYGQELAWIGMILVHPDFRRGGIATLLLEHCLDYLLNQKQIQCVKLDATPAGKAVYEKIGFQEEYEISRWSGESERYLNEPKLSGSKCHYALDHKVFGVDRHEYLQKLKQDSYEVYQSDSGFGMIRDGSNKNYLGPIIANNSEAGRALVMNLLNAIAPPTPVYWDIPEDNIPAVQLAKELNFKRERTLIRMWIGKPVPSDSTLQWAISGPETG